MFLFTFTDKVKLVKGAKPLIHHKFYLDVEKHNVANKIENQIKELGGVSIHFNTLLFSMYTELLPLKYWKYLSVKIVFQENESTYNRT